MKTLKSTHLFISLILILILILQLGLMVNGHGGGGDHDEAEEGSGDGGEEHRHGDLHSKGLVAVKLWCLVILLVTTFAGGVSPYFLRWNESFLLMGTQFAGGVFLGTSLMHFLSDSNETFEDLTPKPYPFAFMLASFGYLLTMLGDSVILFLTKPRGDGDRSARIDPEEQGKVSAGGDLGDTANPVFLRTASLGDTILLILALCFHSIFEGIAIGISDTKADAWRNLWTISLHKIFAAIAMGIALLRMLPKRPLLLTVAYSFAFAVSSPVGVGIGIAINATTQGEAADWTYAISMGLACGVFIYVAINHLIAKGYKPLSKCYFDAPFFKFLAVLLGIGVIAVVMIWD